MTRTCLVAFLLVLVACAPAGAATVTFEPSTDTASPDSEFSCHQNGGCFGSITVTDGVGEANDLVIEGDPYNGPVVIRDAAPLVTGSGCSKEGDGAVRCPAGLVTVRAGAGNDRVRAPYASVDGGDGDDDLAAAHDKYGSQFEGGPGDDKLVGGGGSDSFRGGPGADVIEGGNGDDYVRDEDGAILSADRLDGGPGTDEINFEGRRSPVRVDLGVSPQEGGSPGEGNRLDGFENITGGAGDDELLGPTSTTLVRLLLRGGDGNDRIVGRAFVPAPIAGGPSIGFCDLNYYCLSGDGGDDVITGFAGTDVLSGGAGDDTLDGGGGADDLRGAEGADKLTGGDGDDSLSGEAGGDVLAGGAGKDSAYGDSGADTIDGGDGDDEVSGMAGKDAVDGGAGNDLVGGGSGRDRLRGGSGADRLSARDRTVDDIDCGPGRDRATAARSERAPHCERVSRPKKRRQGRRGARS